MRLSGTLIFTTLKLKGLITISELMVTKDGEFFVFILIFWPLHLSILLLKSIIQLLDFNISTPMMTSFDKFLAIIKSPLIIFEPRFKLREY